MKKGQDWISLPLAKSQQQDPVHLATEISATRLDKMLKKKEVERAFLGLSDWSKRIRGDGNTGGVHDYTEAKVGSGTTFLYPCGP